MPPTRKELILAAVVLFMIPVAAELVLRIVHTEFEPQLYSADRNLGWALRPGVEGVVSGETRQEVRINTQGFRDRPHVYSKSGNTFRIAVLGNSWTEALQVPLEKTYSYLLEQDLSRLPCFNGKQVEVMNFGVSGYSTAQELLLLRQEVWKYHPDLVIVAFYSARDVANNVRQLNNAANPEQSPYFVYHGGQLVLDDSFRKQPAVQDRQIKLQKIRAFITDHVFVLQAINALVRYGRAQVALAALKERSKEAGVDSMDYAVYKPPSSPVLQDAWRVTEGLLIAMRDEATAHGARLRIVTLANRPQVIPDPQKQLELMNSLGVSNLSYADERIDALCMREGIPVTNLAPALEEYAEAHHIFLNGFNKANLGGGHWNETGHQLAAETIAASICPPSELSAEIKFAGGQQATVRAASGDQQR